MTVPLSIALFTTMMALASAICATWSAHSARAARRSATSTRRVRELEVEVTDLHELYGRLFDSHKRLRSRVSMDEIRQEARETRTESSASSSDPKQIDFDRKLKAKPGETRRMALRRLLKLPSSPLEFVRETIKRAQGG